ADLEVQVGTAGVAGAAGLGDLLAGLDDLADLHVDRGQVGVLGVRLVAVLDDDGVAVGGAVAGAVAAGLDDGAAVGGDDRGAGRDGVVLAGVLGSPHAAVLGEARGQLVALHRRDPGRLLLRGGLGGLRGLLGRDGLRLRGLG